MSTDLTKDPDKMSQAELRSEAKGFRKEMRDAEAQIEQRDIMLTDRDSTISQLTEKLKGRDEAYIAKKEEAQGLAKELELAKQEQINIQARCDEAQGNAEKLVAHEREKVQKIRALAENIHSEVSDLLLRTK